MTAYVVDVNVPIVANGQSDHADVNCISACVNALETIVNSGMIVLDNGRRILTEYQRYLNPTGQPGLGDAFMQWLWENQAVETRCEQVGIIAKDGCIEDYCEFPKDPDLQAFDPSDRKYVAVALASRNTPEVLNAVDPDWWQHRMALTRNGVNVRFLCPQHMS